MSLLLTAVFLFCVGLISYNLLLWSYWRRRGISGPMGLPFFGKVLELNQHRISPHLQIREWTKKYGSVYGVTEGQLKLLVISDPDLINEVFVKQYDNFYGRKLNPLQGDPDKDKLSNLFTAQGHRWKRLRNISSPTFSNNSLKKIRQTVEESAAELLRHIENAVADGIDIDMFSYYQEFTLDIISRIALGQHDAEMFKNPLIEKTKKIFGEGRESFFIVSSIFPPLGKLLRAILFALGPNKSNEVVAMFSTIREKVEQRIMQRENEARLGIEIGEPADFIDLFLLARADVEIFDENNADFTKQSYGSNRQLTTDEIVGQCFVFLAAGFDTTALSLSYATYLLATHPRVMRKLQEEIDRECPDPSISFDQTSKLKYLDSILKETLRLYPLATIVNNRCCMRDTKIGKYEIERGVNIQVDTWTVHHDPKIWGDDAGEFRPERWENGDENAYKCAYLPFGLGPRQCIGMRLAQMEEKLLLAHILKKYSFEITPKTDIPLKLKGRTTTQPESVFVDLKPR